MAARRAHSDSAEDAPPAKRVPTTENKYALDKMVTLNNGIEMPIFGLGVYQSRKGQETQDAIKWAFETGYIHVDTARIYQNERDVGVAFRASNIPRDKVFITTKLWNSDQGYDNTLAACNKSLELLGMDYIDLYLVHSPVKGMIGETWRAMEKLVQDGKVKSIGVSNYGIHHLEKLFETATIKPVVNQLELNPYIQRRELVQFCVANGIIPEAYSPLTKGIKLEEPVLVKIARKHSKSSAQVMIRWALQKDFIVIPKSVRRDRIIENAAVFDFELDGSDMEKLDALDEYLVTGWDPTTTAV